MYGIQDNYFFDFSVLKFIILECNDKEYRQFLEDKLQMVFNDLNGCYDELFAQDYHFLHFLNSYSGLDDLNKTDLILTYRMMIHGITDINFRDYSLDELMLCTMVMRSYSFSSYKLLGSFLCHEQVVKAVMKNYHDLEAQLKVYEEDMLDCTLCLKHFLERLNLSRIDSGSKQFQYILSALLSIIQKYNVSFGGSVYRKRLGDYEDR